MSGTNIVIGIIGINVGIAGPTWYTSYYSVSVDEPMATMEMEADMNADMDMSPEPVDVESDTPPTVEIVEAFTDKMGAYSLQIATENFTFTPELIDQDPVQNEGHAHVYVDGEKVGREYAGWIYIPASYFSGTGPHRITVSLNANTHAAWHYLDAPVQATTMVD